MTIEWKHEVVMYKFDELNEIEWTWFLGWYSPFPQIRKSINMLGRCSCIIVTIDYMYCRSGATVFKFQGSNGRWHTSRGLVAAQDIVMWCGPLERDVFTHIRGEAWHQDIMDVGCFMDQGWNEHQRHRHRHKRWNKNSAAEINGVKIRILVYIWNVCDLWKEMLKRKGISSSFM